MGTTGTCNASCASCPTNKLVREHVPSGIMPLATFKRVIDEIAEGGFVFGKNKLGLGLFAEPLMDPHIVERVEYVRERLLRMRVLLNTNMGPFNERRHAVLAKLVFRFSVHVEALSPALYAELMEPLRAENVFPKIERLLELAPDKVNIAVPISTRNEAEFDALRAYWMGKGARNVCDLALSNRTTDALDYFEKSLGTAPTACGESVHDDLVIDWDGTVLACCQDFMRREVLGNINESSITEIYDAEARRQVHRRAQGGRMERARLLPHVQARSEGRAARVGRGLNSSSPHLRGGAEQQRGGRGSLSPPPAPRHLPREHGGGLVTIPSTITPNASKRSTSWKP